MNGAIVCKHAWQGEVSAPLECLRTVEADNKGPGPGGRPRVPKACASSGRPIYTPRRCCAECPTWASCPHTKIRCETALTAIKAGYKVAFRGR